MVRFVEVYYVLGRDDMIVATIEKADDGGWGACYLEDVCIGEESTKAIYKKLKELNNA